MHVTDDDPRGLAAIPAEVLERDEGCKDPGVATDGPSCSPCRRARRGSLA